MITRVLPVLLALSTIGAASPLMVELTGQFASNVPTTVWSQPNATVEMTAEIDSDPVFDHAVGQYNLYYQVPFTNFSYSLAGMAVSTVPNMNSWQLVEVGRPGPGFFGTDMFFNLELFPDGTSTQLDAGFPLMTSGAASAPILVAGVWTEPFGSIGPLGGIDYGFNDVVLTVTAIPEPAGYPLLLIALAGSLAYPRRILRSRS